MQHESAADGIVDVALIRVDKMVGAFRRRDDSLDGDFARVHGVHMPDEPVALVGGEERRHGDPPVASVLPPLLGGEARHLHVAGLGVFGAGHFSGNRYFGRAKATSSASDPVPVAMTTNCRPDRAR